MPTDLPDRLPEPPPERDRVSGKLVVVVILLWTLVMAMWAVYATRSGLADAVYENRHPGQAAPAEPAAP